MNGKYFENKFQIPYMSSFITKTHFNLILQSPAPIIQIQKGTASYVNKTSTFRSRIE